MRMHRLAASLLLLVAATSLSAQPTAGRSVSSGFVLATGDFWLNLHQFLYVLGRAQAGSPDRTRRAVVDAPADQASGLEKATADERAAWSAAVDGYAQGLSRQDAIFDAPLIAIGTALARAGDSATLDAVKIDPATRSILERAAPIYRRLWWPAHRAANEGWKKELDPLLAEHGSRVVAYVTRAYGFKWPANGQLIHVSAWANWAGAFSTTGDFIVISSLDPGNKGLNALESAVHEAMHQWDEQADAMLNAEARRQNKRAPDLLSHAMIFFTSGEAVRAVAPGHVTYAESNGMWRRGMGQFKPALDKAWMPWLRGEGTREAALRMLVEMAGTPLQSTL